MFHPQTQAAFWVDSVLIHALCPCWSKLVKIYVGPRAGCGERATASEEYGLWSK